MWKATIKYYLTKNLLGCIFAALHWVIAYKALSNLHLDTSSEFSEIGMILIIILDLPALLPVAVLLCPFAVFGFEVYLVLVGFVSIFAISFQWLVIGKKIRRFFSPTESEKSEMSIIDNS